MQRRSAGRRFVALVTSFATVLMLAGSAAPAFAGNTRHVTIGSAADGQLPSVTVSAGESIMFPLTVKNNGKQTLNNVVLVVGRDSVPAPENDPASALVPLPPVDLPTGVSITDSGTGGTKCVAGATLRCTVGTLSARTSFAITVTISSTRDAVAAVIPTKAVVTVAEIGNDQGSNTDTFAAEGSLNLLAFSCDSISAYRTHNQSKVVSTCAVTRSARDEWSVRDHHAAGSPQRDRPQRCPGPAVPAAARDVLQQRGRRSEYRPRRDQ